MQLSDRLAAELPTGTVRLSTPVIRVDQHSGDGVTVTAGDGSTYTGEYAISAVPLALLNRIQFQPAVSARKRQLIQSMPMGSCVKTMTYYDKPYWRKAGMSGQAATDVGVTVWCIDDTKPDGSTACLVGFVNGAYVSHGYIHHCYSPTIVGRRHYKMMRGVCLCLDLTREKKGIESLKLAGQLTHEPI